MREDDTSKDFPQQAPLGKRRVVFRKNGEPAVALEQDGVVSLHKLQITPDALWNTEEFWDVSLPEWAESVDDPPSQFLAIIVDRVGRQRQAVAELEIVLPALRELRRLIKQSGDADLLQRIDAIGVRTKLVLAELDRP